MARPLRGGEGVRAWPLRKNAVFRSSKIILEKKFVATKLEGGGKALVAGPLKNAASLSNHLAEEPCLDLTCIHAVNGTIEEG